MSDSFGGFPREGSDFLRDVATNNNKPWFEANRRRYDEGLLGPGRLFVSAMGMALSEFAPGIHADPRVSGSIFRIHRDIRFSRDKRPYKTHFDLWFWQGDRHSRDCPGYFLRLTPDRVPLGAGRYAFDKATLEAFSRSGGGRQSWDGVGTGAGGSSSERRGGGRRSLQASAARV